ncbi:MAG: serine hydrolase domain-containing protein [Cellvibrionaceae bacterium]
MSTNSRFSISYVLAAALIVLSGCANTDKSSHLSPNASKSISQNIQFSSPEKVGISSERLDNVSTILNDYVEQGEFVGAVSMIARHGNVVHFEKFGDLNKDAKQEIELDSIFRIYSMTKPITTVAAMMLYEEGKFQLTDPVAKYLPEFKNILVLNESGQLEKQNRPFTIQMLMSHTAGLTYGVFGNTPVDQQYRKAGILGNKDLAEMVTELGKIPLQYQPGSKWHYSVSVDVLGRLVEVLSGQPLDIFLKERMFDPLEMTDTFFQVPEEKINRFGTNHRYNQKTQKLEVIDSPETSQYTKEVTFFSGGGGLLSTAEDYMKFCQMMLNGGSFNGHQILGSKTIEYMTQNHLKGIFANRSGENGQNRPGSGFGLGFGVLLDAAEAGVIGSEGEYYWGGAAGTVFWIDPVEDLIAIVMVQHMNVQVPLRNAMKAAIYGSLVD